MSKDVRDRFKSLALHLVIVPFAFMALFVALSLLYCLLFIRT
jgi:hypothetical protein